ncbi:IclR family transcriptional regulator [Chelatococcus reniformis]|uniref:Transcriptional regulator n=1 Tax=Chelatococcus reniformis TaxID=1494448 RepID=A0A916URF2_9HYPH|nr:helix-turn-helix domain-containing protein [Chelatococcus reniformis]GGC81534.1 transcriptional regulator [Chelatococcus reniformis]
MSEEVIKTARRLFEILEYFDVVQRPLSLKDVAGRFDYPVSSASALLKSMVVLGYLDYDRYSRTYMPTMRIVQLGGWVQGALFGEGSIVSLMKYLSKETEETISIGTQSDLYMQYIHTLPSPHTIQFAIQPGTIRPLARSGLGWLILSARSDEMIEKLVRRINIEEDDPKHRVDLVDLMQRIREIRANGYVISLHTVTVGAGVIGMLLPERRHGRILAVGVGGPVVRLVEQRDQILQALRAGIDRFLPMDEH